MVVQETYEKFQAFVGSDSFDQYPLKCCSDGIWSHARSMAPVRHLEVDVVSSMTLEEIVEITRR